MFSRPNTLSRAENEIAPLGPWKENANAALSEIPQDRVSPQETTDARKRVKETRARSSTQRESARGDDSVAGAVKQLQAIFQRGDENDPRGRSPNHCSADRARSCERGATGAGLADRRDHGAHVAALEIGGWAATRDRRPHAVRSTPAHALSAQEREQLLRVANEPRFAEPPPARIVPMLADEGRIWPANPTSAACCELMARFVIEGERRHPAQASAVHACSHCAADVIGHGSDLSGPHSGSDIGCYLCVILDVIQPQDRGLGFAGQIRPLVANIGRCAPAAVPQTRSLATRSSCSRSCALSACVACCGTAQ